jgi:hypothetical protein
VVDYAVRIEPIGGIIWFTVAFRRGEERGSLNHAYTLPELGSVPFSLVEHGLKIIKARIESFTGEPARLVRLQLVGQQDWISERDHEAIRAAQREIEDSRA